MDDPLDTRLPIDKKKSIKLLKGALVGIVCPILAALILSHFFGAGKSADKSASSPCSITAVESMTLMGNSFKGLPCASQDASDGTSENTFSL